MKLNWLCIVNLFNTRLNLNWIVILDQLLMLYFTDTQLSAVMFLSEMKPAWCCHLVVWSGILRRKLWVSDLCTGRAWCWPRPAGTAWSDPPGWRRWAWPHCPGWFPPSWSRWSLRSSPGLHGRQTHAEQKQKSNFQMRFTYSRNLENLLSGWWKPVRVDKSNAACETYCGVVVSCHGNWSAW